MPFIKFISESDDGSFRVGPGVIPSDIVTATFVDLGGATFSVSIVHDAEGALVAGIDGAAAWVLCDCFDSATEIELVYDLLTPPDSA